MEERRSPASAPSSPRRTSKPESAFDAMPPKFAFWAGVVTATAVISVIGFIAMATMVIKGVDLGSDSDKKTTKTTKTADAGTAGAAPTAAAASGSVDLDNLLHVRGEGEFTIIEYSDLECPFCKRFHETMKQVMADYDGQVAWAYKQFPLASLHPKAPRESEASECAGLQGKFWEYTDKIFEVTPSNNKLEDDQLFTIADDVGLDVDEFTTCLEEGETKDIVTADGAEAQSLGGQGTPFSVIVGSNGDVVQTIPGALPIDSISATLDGLLN